MMNNAIHPVRSGVARRPVSSIGAGWDTKYNLARLRILGYIVSFELTQYDIRSARYEI